MRKMINYAAFLVAMSVYTTIGLFIVDFIFQNTIFLDWLMYLPDWIGIAIEVLISNAVGVGIVSGIYYGYKVYANRKFERRYAEVTK